MSFQSILINCVSTLSDWKRDMAIPLPGGVTECRNIRYGSHGKWNLLDVYYPDHTAAPLPTIVSIHGGAYVYGTKEIYRRYGLDMARRGFAFVNFNYRLAPQWKFPTPLWDTNSVMDWVCKNAARYHLDPQNIILIGDSAGAQLASQYAAIAANPDYAARFPMEVPEITIRCLGLSCGLYDMTAHGSQPRRGIHRDYLGRDLPKNDPRFQVLESITAAYPPAFITTACHDFLRANAAPMQKLLQARGVEAELKCYGTKADKSTAHVFHVNITTTEAKRCNDDAAAFFLAHLG